MKYLTKLISRNIPGGNADFSRALETERIAAHWITLEPHSRSSSPHAESLEEEFVYIVSGRPHVWIDGYIYQLEEKMAVGFKAGTGISHTVINNTDLPVELIVLGERTKRENKCGFPVNPELQPEHKDIWWNEQPKLPLGPHDGTIGNLLYARSPEDCPIIKSVLNVKREASFSYPEDNETFGNGLRLSDVTGLEKLGVWHEILKPNKRSAWPHAHKIEEEMAIVLSGTAIVWVNGTTAKLERGDTIYFKPGTNQAHVLINNSEADFEYIGLGEAKLEDGAKDLIHYPLHEARNDQCRHENWYWHDAPTPTELGADLAMPEPRSLEIRSEKNPSEFLKVAAGLLYSREAEYSLIIGFCLHQIKFEKTDYLYFHIYQNGELIAVALVSDKNLIVTAAPGPVLNKFARFLAENKISFGGVVGPAVSAEAITRSYAQATNRGFKVGFKQRLFKNESVIEPKNQKGSAYLATSDDEELVAQWLLNFQNECLPHETVTLEKMRSNAKEKIQADQVYLWRDESERPVSMCCLARPTKNGVTINGVYTSPDSRKNGYGSAVVAFATKNMLNAGKIFCVLYTDVANPTSNKIYKAIGYTEVANSTHYLLL